MRRDAIDVVAAVQHGEDVADLLGEVRRHRFGLLQDRHACAQPVIAHQGADVERRRDDDAVDVAPFPGRLGLWRAVLVLDRLALPLTGPPNAEIDSTGMERVQHPEALDDRDGGGVAELHCGGADADAVGGGRDLTDQNRGR